MSARAERNGSPAEERTAGRIYRPRNLAALHKLYLRNPDALLYAGGTEILPAAYRGAGRLPDLPDKVIYLGNVQELSRILRTQRHLVIGSCLPISRILSTGRSILPPVLYEALEAIATPAVRNLATLGGNLCSSLSGGDALPVLLVIGARLELRGESGSHWMGIDEFARAGLPRTEIITRIRIPLEDYDAQIYRKVGSGDPGAPALLNFCGVARFAKGQLELFRFSVGGSGRPALRYPDLEARLEGLKLPLPLKQVDLLVREVAERMQPPAEQRSDGQRAADQSAGDEYRRATALRLLARFIRDINSG
jgi:CO/xanthine dehydrogenase FAD-binding subunit